MGVPGFFRWIKRRVPAIIDGNAVGPVPPDDPNGPPRFHHVYMDFNGVVHGALDGVVAPEADEDGSLLEEAIFVLVEAELERLLRCVLPTILLYIGVDGIAPRSKANQQRTRRYRSAMEKDEAAAEAAAAAAASASSGSGSSGAKKFDRNAITACTEFMLRLTLRLKAWAERAAQVDSRLKGVTIVISGDDCPGEGEHKIMDVIRQRTQCGYKKESHCLLGADADLLLLGAVTGLEHFYIFREEHKDGVKTGLFDILRLEALKEYFTDVRFPGRNPSRLMEDFIALCCLVGNDFLPAVATCRIEQDGLDRILRVYEDRSRAWGPDAFLVEPTSEPDIGGRRLVFPLWLDLFQELVKQEVEQILVQMGLGLGQKPPKPPGGFPDPPGENWDGLTCVVTQTSEGVTLDEVRQSCMPADGEGDVEIVELDLDSEQSDVEQYVEADAKEAVQSTPPAAAEVTVQNAPAADAAEAEADAVEAVQSITEASATQIVQSSPEGAAESASNITAREGHPSSAPAEDLTNQELGALVEVYAAGSNPPAHEGKSEWKVKGKGNSKGRRKGKGKGRDKGKGKGMPRYGRSSRRFLAKFERTEGAVRAITHGMRKVHGIKMVIASYQPEVMVEEETPHERGDWRPLVEREILSCMEYWLSSANLPKDAFLRRHVRLGGAERFVPIDIFLRFAKMRTMSQDAEYVAQVLGRSSELEVRRASTGHWEVRAVNDHSMTEEESPDVVSFQQRLVTAADTGNVEAAGMLLLSKYYETTAGEGPVAIGVPEISDPLGRGDCWAHAYMRGIEWVVRYYTGGLMPPSGLALGSGTASWRWFYPAHYAPMCSDLARACSQTDWTATSGASEAEAPAAALLARRDGPLPAELFLLSVLPPQSASLFKSGPLQNLLSSADSPLACRFPRSIPLKIPPGANPARVYDHQMLVLVPFVEEEELRDAVQKAEGRTLADMATDIPASAYVMVEKERVSDLQRFPFSPKSWEPILVPGVGSPVMYSDLLATLVSPDL